MMEQQEEPAAECLSFSELPEGVLREVLRLLDAVELAKLCVQVSKRATVTGKRCTAAAAVAMGGCVAVVCQHSHLLHPLQLQDIRLRELGSQQELWQRLALAK